MKRRSVKAAVWIVLAAAIVSGFLILLDTADKAETRDINPESLLISEFAGSSEMDNLAWNILSGLRSWQENPKNAPDFSGLEARVVYRAESGKAVLTNAPGLAPADFGKEAYRYIREIPAGGGEPVTDTTLDFMGYLEDGAKGGIYFYVPEDVIGGIQDQWEQDRSFLWERALALGILALLVTACCVLLVLGAGRTTREEGIVLLSTDRWFTEIYLALAAGFLAGSGALVIAGIRWAFSYGNQGLSWEGRALLGVAAALLFILAIALSMPLVRKTKARTFLSGSFVYQALAGVFRMFRGLFRGVRGFFDGSAYKEAPLTRRLFRGQVTYISASAVLLFVCVFLAFVSYSLFFLLVFGILELVLTAWHVMGTRRVLGEIDAGFDQSFRERVRSENIKTALITNVSHDLKTPLTSIISYVDLLSKEEGLSENAKEYVGIISGKADRLSHMVSDLFDLSKSVSGNIPLEMEVLDLRTLLEQTLADMKDRVEDSGLAVKASLGDGPAPVFSDGKKLYRVFQNVIDNGLKYGLAGSRLYIDLAAGDRAAAVTIKNTAAYEMDFTPEEILQRFTRGDKARTGEGSGLGLSIAESFTQSCGGRFKVDIDGDQFKVTIAFPLHAEGGR